MFFFFRPSPELARYVHRLSPQGHGRYLVTIAGHELVSEGHRENDLTTFVRARRLDSLSRLRTVLCCNINVEIHD